MRAVRKVLPACAERWRSPPSDPMRLMPWKMCPKEQGQKERTEAKKLALEMSRAYREFQDAERTLKTASASAKKQAKADSDRKRAALDKKTEAASAANQKLQKKVNWKCPAKTACMAKVRIN